MRFPALNSATGDWTLWIAAGVLACVSTLLSGPVHAQEAFFIYFQCSAEGSNLNDGESVYQDHVGWGGVKSYLEGAQRDMLQDGSSAGSFQHSGVTIVKKLTRSSPLYMDALYQNTTLQTCTIRFYRPNSEQEEENYYTVALTNAKVAFISNQGSDQEILEEITFRAQSIRRTEELAAVESQQSLVIPP